MKFKSSYLMAVCLIFLTFFIDHAGAEESKALPSAMTEQTSVEFPPAIAGSDVTHVFKIQNKGNASLNIPGIYTE